MTELLGSNSPCHAASVTQWAGSSHTSWTLLRCLTFCGGTSSLRIWSGWIRKTFERLAPRCEPCRARSARRYRPALSSRDVRQRAATQILTGHACLNYHLSKLNRSVQPLCPLCEAEYDTVSHLLAQCPMLWQLRVEYCDTHYTTVTNIVDRYNLRRIISYVNTTNRLEFRDTEAMFHDKSSDPETFFYCNMISTWVVSTWDWAPLPCAQAYA